MKTRWRIFLPALACSLLAQTNFPQQSLQTGAGLAAAAARRNFRETPGIAVDSRQHVFVIHRGEHPIMEFDAAGHFVCSFGDTLFDRTHAVRFDPEGNLWAVDDGSHVVLKLDSEGHARMVLGRCRKPGDAVTPVRDHAGSVTKISCCSIGRLDTIRPETGLVVNTWTAVWSCMVINPQDMVNSSLYNRLL